MTTCLLRGLKEELRVHVQLFKPTELTQAINTVKKCYNLPWIYGARRINLDAASLTTPIKGNQQVVSFSLGRKRRRKGLKLTHHTRKSQMLSTKRGEHQDYIFTMMKKYSYGHVCKNKQFNLIIVDVTPHPKTNKHAPATL